MPVAVSQRAATVFLYWQCLCTAMAADAFSEAAASVLYFAMLRCAVLLGAAAYSARHYKQHYSCLCHL